MQFEKTVPYSGVGLERLAQALNVGTAAIWVNPVTNALQLRESALTTAGPVVGHGGDHASAGLELRDEYYGDE